MKLSKNNKIYIAQALKDKTNWQNYSETKAASICMYNSEIVLYLTLDEFKSFNIDSNEIDNFSNFLEVFKNEENHKKLLNQIVIKSENPFISSILNMNRVSKIKYFNELICLNKVELKEEYDFFNDFFDKIHNHNYFYIYRTNKIDEYAEIRFSINIDDLYTKTYLISKEPFLEQRKNEEYSDNKLVNFNYNNHTTIKEVSEDDLKNKDSLSQYNLINKDNNNINKELENINNNIGIANYIKENEPTLSRISMGKLGKNNNKGLSNDEDIIEMGDVNSNEGDNIFLNELENIEKWLTNNNGDKNKKNYIDFDLEEGKDKEKDKEKNKNVN
jgi:hypothetical protein